MGIFRKLVDSMRGTLGPTFTAMQSGNSIRGSAYAPAPPSLTVPEELRRAVDDERRAAAETDEPTA